ncbi:MAG: signal recognition particle protein [Planctomycetota bacterium]
MFETITEGLKKTFERLRGRGRLSESDVKEAMREIRQALLAADVSYKVVKDFIATVTERAVGEEVLRSVSPGQQVVKIVHDALVDLMGPVDHAIRWSAKGPTVILLAGLQGTGKTTFAAKLARYLKKRGKHPLMVAADIKRPAAIDQLKVLGEQVDVPVYEEGTGGRTPRICSRAVKEAAKTGRDVVILDTAGRLAIDREMMDEVKAVAKKVAPDEIFLVCDAMTGQDAVNSAKAFNEILELTGVILTKLDGDARGGAAMSVKAVTGRPIKFAGVGEKVEDIEEFHPDRMAGRILGMGDIVTLVEKAQDAIDQEAAQEQAEKLFTGTFTMDDFLGLFEQMKKLGPMKKVMEMAGPGFDQLTEGMSSDEIETQMARTKAMILSMTPRERFHPEVLDVSRRRRVAKGSGTSLGDVNQLVKEFKQARKMFKQVGQQGGLAGAMAKRGFRKRKSRQLKDIKATGGQLPVDIPGFSTGDGGVARQKKRKKKKRR